jgi:two-component system, NtrC family, nitrogen regulation response regulator GlnG
VRAHGGFFGAADNGTLFLDEVGETPLDVQASLLRALDTGEVQPLGAARTRHAQARIIAATDADLDARVRMGTFRAPLLHRLSSYELVLPPLRQRRDDIGLLLLHFLRVELGRAGAGRSGAAERGALPSLPGPFVAALARYRWPGNIRQLHNVVCQIVLGSDSADMLRPSPALSELFASAEPRGHESEANDPGAAAAPEPAQRRKPSDVGEEELLAALRVCRFDLKATAERLGISRTSLYALVEQCPKVRRASDIDAEELRRCLEECDGNIAKMAENLEVSRHALQRRLRELKIV